MRLTLSGLALATLSAVHAPGLPAQRLAGNARLADSARVAIERATTMGDAARLLAVRRMLDAAIAAAPDDALLLHYQGYAAYRLANLTDPAQVADRLGHLAAARYMLRRSLALRPLPEGYMLVSIVESRLAAMDSTLASRLDAEAQRATQAALVSSGAENPRVLLLAGISALYTPPSLDGGPAAAEQLLTRAIALYATDRPAAPLPAWGEAESYAWLGQVYERSGRLQEAAVAYNHALRVEPGFTWVRDVLLPALRLRMR
jgi:tetratricopeptide (TPR) repeat protein